MIGRHIFWDIFYKRATRGGQYDDIDDSNEGICTLFFKRKLVPVMVFFAFLMQLGAMIAVPVLLALTEDRYRGSDNYDRYMTMYILIPVTLTVLSIVWSGWIQYYLVEPRTKKTTVQGVEYVARMKSGKHILAHNQFNSP